MLQVHLLGPLRVVGLDGSDLTPSGGRERQCLATLAIAAPEALSAERLSTELYPDHEPRDPRNAVQAVISRLRRALGPHAASVETTAGGYRLVDIAVDTDVALRQLAEVATESDPEIAASALSAALECWRGTPLDGLEGELVDAERIRIEKLRAGVEDAVFERRLQASPEARLDSRLLAELEAAASARPLREKRWEMLMLALYRDGQQAEALRTYQRARTFFIDSLGLEPSPALVELERRILDHDPELMALDRHGATAPARHRVGSVAEPEGTEVDLPSGTLTLVICDVVDSVKRWEANPAEMAGDIASFHAAWERETSAHGGHLVRSSGDGALAVFTTAPAAMQAAAAALAENERGPLSVRVAVHAGAIEPAGGDYRGPAVNRCARLAELAQGGQILVSGTAAELARPDLPESLSFNDLGHHWLRDVGDPIAVYQLNGPGLQTSFGPPRSSGAMLLPRLRSNLVGRDDLVARIEAEIGQHPLVTLVGPGGVGKTSVALAVAWNTIGRRPVTFVDLAASNDASAVTVIVAEQLGMSDVDGEQAPLEWIAARLSRSTELVLLDNAEHVVEAVVELVDGVLSRHLEGSFLVTSRQPLMVPGEVVIDIPTLSTELEGRDLNPAVRLFLDRLPAVRSQTGMDNDVILVVARICSRLDGLPLAIELAASRAAVLSVDEIAARLDNQLQLLRQVRSSGQHRHESLEAVVGWSVQQLSEPARDLFERLSVMAGGFSVDGAEQVAGYCGLDPSSVLDGLEELVRASLIVAEPRTGRLRMLEPIRQYADAQLAEHGHKQETQRSYVRWLTDLLADAHGRRDQTRGKAMARLEPESDHFRAGLGWLATTDGELDLVAEIALPAGWWYLSHDARQGERLMGQLLSRSDLRSDPLVWALVVMGLATATAAQPRSAVADSSLEAVAILDRHDHPDTALCHVPAAFAQTGLFDVAVPLGLLDEADRRISSDDMFARAVVDLAVMVFQSMLISHGQPSADPAEVMARGERAVATFAAMEEQWPLGVALTELGRLHQHLGDTAEAETRFLQGLDQLSDARDYHGRHYVFTELGRLASARGEHERAARFHDKAEELAATDANPGCMAMVMAGKADAAEQRGDPAAAIGLYRQALDLIDIHSFVEHGAADWQRALARLSATDP